MRSKLLDIACELFERNGLGGVSITAIAEAADAFPSQITYYFKTKEALFAEAACREMLHVAKQAEIAAARARTPHTYMSALVENVLTADRLFLFIEALMLTRQRPDLKPQIKKTVERLHFDGARAFEAELARRKWRPINDPDETSRRFWAIALGIALEGQGMGRSKAEMSAAMKDAFGEMAEG